MPQARVTMRKIRDILRLAWSCNQSRQAIATACGIGKTTVSDTLCRASAANLSWPLPLALDDEGLETLLYPTNHSSSPRKYTQSDWYALNSEFLTHKKPDAHASVAGVQGAGTFRLFSTALDCGSSSVVLVQSITIPASSESEATCASTSAFVMLAAFH
jgi:hypothetical protein